MIARRVWAVVGVVLLTIAVGACTEQEASARSEQDIPLRIGVLSDPTTVTMDPVAATDPASQAFVFNTFQRLMTVKPGTGLLKPDAAAECTFIDEVTYSCSLNKQLQFVNGDELTASDVKFSIERAQRLARPGTGAEFLDSLAEVQLVSEDRVDFKLTHPDNQFGQVLASPAASIVDEEVYPMDRIRSNTQKPVGSGPVQMVRAGDGEMLYWTNFDYRGRNPARTINQLVKQYDSPQALRDAAAAGELDVVWDAAALDAAPPGFHEDTFANGRVEWLRWNPASPLRERADLRGYVRDAVQPMRSMRSVLPRGTDTATPVFDTGPRDPRGPGEATVTLWHQDRPDQESVAQQVADQLERDGAVTVELTTAKGDADLYLESPKPWIPTPLAWFQPYLDDPLPGTEERNAQAVLALRTAFTQPDKQAASTTLQQYAHDDATVVPLTVGDQVVYLGPTVELSRDNTLENYMAPGFQLGVWGFSL